MGRIFLKEKINKNKSIAIFLVFLSIIYLLIEFKDIPWIGLTVAITFSFYTLIRKKINISSDIGLFFETLLISPIALILFSSLVFNNTNVFGFDNPTLSFYLFFAGFMTLVPLFMYIKGFELIGIGPASMIFFLTPTAQFFLSIFYLGQPLEIEKLISFLFIWIAVIIYLNELRKEWNKIIIRGTNRDIRKDIRNTNIALGVNTAADVELRTRFETHRNTPSISPFGWPLTHTPLALFEEGGRTDTPYKHSSNMKLTQSGKRTRPVPISKEARKQQLIDEILTLQNK